MNEKSLISSIYQNTMPQNIQELNAILKSNGFRADWPQCSGKVCVSKTHLFAAANSTTEAKGIAEKREKISARRLDGVMHQ